MKQLIGTRNKMGKYLSSKLALTVLSYGLKVARDTKLQVIGLRGQVQHSSNIGMLNLLKPTPRVFS